MNNLTISGRCIGDIKYTPGDNPRANFTLAVYDPKGKQNDKGYREDMLFGVTCFGKTADYVNNHGFKQAQAIVVGAVSIWHGDRGASLSVTANQVEITSRPTDGSTRATATAKVKSTKAPIQNDDGSDDPFSQYAD